MSNDREVFEKWAKDNMNAGATNGMIRHENGDYLWGGTALAWKVWQAATAAAEEKYLGGVVIGGKVT